VRLPERERGADPRGEGGTEDPLERGRLGTKEEAEKRWSEEPRGELGTEAEEAGGRLEKLELRRP
jgi:hypothetical protein